MRMRHKNGRFLQGLLALIWLGVLHGTELFSPGSEWRLFRPKEAGPGPDSGLWRMREFDDSGWEAARAPFSYGMLLGGTVLGDMRGSYTTIYLRKKVVILAPAEVERLIFHVVAEDGFVAWLDGYEVARRNVSADDPRFDDRANVEVMGSARSESYVIDDVKSSLAPGTHIIAVQVFSTGPADEDLMFDAWLEAELDQTPPTVERVVPEPGSIVRDFSFIEVQFSEPVIGVNASDLLINRVPATNVVQITPSH
ncbi:MAG: Ig-like domain-containing protein, partial [Verrucomicrobiae bacterium]|nr:Ig-like domain-containing protein [Verrucomicrobiae bacterium]